MTILVRPEPTTQQELLALNDKLQRQALQKAKETPNPAFTRELLEITHEAALALLNAPHPSKRKTKLDLSRIPRDPS